LATKEFSVEIKIVASHATSRILVVDYSSVSVEPNRLIKYAAQSYCHLGFFIDTWGREPGGETSNCLDFQPTRSKITTSDRKRAGRNVAIDPSYWL